MFLQTLSHNELNDLLEYLKTYKLQYKNKVNLPENLTFGIEIEGVGKWFDSFSEKISDEGWKIADDISLLDAGDEAISPILRNEPKSWGSIKYMCELLKNNGIYISDRCAGHIHYGHDGLIDEDSEKLFNIMKLWAAYESVIYKYSAGNFATLRDSIWEYAKPYAKHIKKLVENMGNNEFDYKTMIYLICKGRHYGVNIENLWNAFASKNLPTTVNNTIEVRVPNGTLNPVIWQNNIRFFGNLFTCATEAKFDDERIKYIIQKLPFSEYNVNRKSDFSFYKHINLPLALELADTIFTDDDDKYSFLAQYLYGDNVFENPQEKEKTLVMH